MVWDFIEKDLIQFVKEVSRNVIVFGVDVSSSPHFDNNKKTILILGKGPTVGLEHILTA